MDTINAVDLLPLPTWVIVLNVFLVIYCVLFLIAKVEEKEQKEMDDWYQREVIEKRKEEYRKRKEGSN